MIRWALAALILLVTPWAAEAQFLLKQSTAFKRPFNMVDSTDHVSGKTGLSPACKISKDGANTGSPGGSVTEVSSSNMPGVYYIAYTTGDTGTVGSLSAYCTGTAADPVTFTDLVVDPAVALVSVNAIQLGGTAQTGRDIGASVLLSSGTGTGQIKISSGYVAPDWGDVGNKTTTNALTGTTIATTQKVDVETIKTNAVVNGGTLTFPSNATLASTTNITAGTITTCSTATSVTNRVTANVDQIDGAAWSTHATGMCPADLRDIAGSAVSTSSAQLGVNVVNFGGSAGTFSSGIPDVNTVKVAGTSQTAGDIIGDTNDIQSRLPAALTGAGNIKADVQVNSDKTGYALTQSFPTNFADLAITASTGRVTAGTVSDKTGYSLAVAPPTVDDILASQAMAAGTVSGTPSTTVVAASDLPASLDDDGLKNRIVIFLGTTSTGGLAYQARRIFAYDTATKTLTLEPALTTAPTAGDVFIIR